MIASENQARSSRIPALRDSVVRVAPTIGLLAMAATVYGLGQAGLVGRDLAMDLVRLQSAPPIAMALALAAYAVAFAVLTGGGLPVALLLTLASGAAFGPWLGGAATALGATGGATLAHLAVRTAAAPWFATKTARHPRLAKIARELRDGAFWHVLALRLSPLAPFPVVNLAAGLAAVPIRPYVAATLIGALPMSFLYSSVGAALGLAAAMGTTPAALVRSPLTATALAALLVLAVVPSVIRLCRRS